MTTNEEVPPALAGERLDRVVSLLAGCSRTEATRWIAEGRVAINGEAVTARSRHLEAGEVVSVDVPEAADPTPLADRDVEFRVVHADDDVIVIDKPAGLVVHPGSGHPDGTLVNGLLAQFPEIASVGQSERPGIVHRLDRGTSGLLVVARTQTAYEALVGDLAAHRVLREYRAVVVGHPDSGRGLIDAPIGRSARNATRMAVQTTGKPARTRYEVVETFSKPLSCALIRCELETGRTHQIRVHVAAIGHPVLGDTTYGGTRSELGMSRPFLHAHTLGFTHPGTGEHVELSAPLPNDLVEILSQLS